MRVRVFVTFKGIEKMHVIRIFSMFKLPKWLYTTWWKHKQNPRKVVIVLITNADHCSIVMLLRHWASDLVLTNGTRQHEYCRILGCSSVPTIALAPQPSRPVRDDIGLATFEEDVCLDIYQELVKLDHNIKIYVYIFTACTLITGLILETPLK